MFLQKWLCFGFVVIPYVRIACYLAHSWVVICELHALAPSSWSICMQAGWLSCKGRGTWAGWPGAPTGWVARLPEQDKLHLDSARVWCQVFLTWNSIYSFKFVSLSIWWCHSGEINLNLCTPISSCGILGGNWVKENAKLYTPGHVDLPDFSPPVSVGSASLTVRV